ncbi:hypothetical protein BJAS_P3296 [Bathymodiolus japonicus methanotrophic gill symbiont]|uniref:plasmid mobilization protein n=1 Tax=Bathymodiolus japonicus methanotrophic gill symbiont TaxID=113269 RepID=UPI001B56F943|nr:plasmid mobilization relaxosome protein MobC [Bathymodiolus japonicus methanotrophic gill symbiont]GFO72796.1 hypothetical protein BJAS_P3296 [Bathymodiolus japonicus methanotrophic gill symbiont]
MNDTKLKKKRKKITKDQGLYIRVTKSEKDKIVEKAKLANISVARLVLESLGRVRTWTIPNKKIESEKIREIRRIGNNLNQVAAWCNKYKNNADSVQVLIHLKMIENLTKDLMSDSLPKSSFPPPDSCDSMNKDKED